MRELDLLMSNWLERCYADAPREKQAHFRRLLDVPDPQLLAWLTGREGPPDPDLLQLIDEIRDH